MILKGRGPKGPFTHKISQKKYERLLYWLTPSKSYRKAGMPLYSGCLLRGSEYKCTFFGGGYRLSPEPGNCSACLLYKLFGEESCRADEAYDIELTQERVSDSYACDETPYPEDVRTLSNARRQLRRMAERGAR